MTATRSFHRKLSLQSAIALRHGFWNRSVVIVQQTHSTHFFQETTGRIAPISNSDESLAQEQGTTFRPRFDAAGLLSAVVQDADSGEVLMVAFMDREALDATRRTGLAHFHSRSRGRLWKKGESSGHVLRVDTILVDCDQDALVIKARPAGPACHTGARSCFYRALEDVSSGASLTHQS